MPTPTWTPGTLYPNGAIVQPASAPPIVPTPIDNPGFESGDVDWTKGTGWTIGTVGPFSGSYAAQYSFTGTSDIINDAVGAVTPGQSITAACQVQQGASSAGQAGARVMLIWYTAADVEISRSLGNQVDDASGGAWRPSSVTAEAPATAAKVKVGARAFRNSGSNPLWIDQFTWNHSGPSVLEGLVYRAVQDGVGTSASTEPTWPLTLGVQVNDGTVIWEAVAATRVVWQATPLFRTGATEPTWPTTPGDTVADGSLIWEAVTRRVTDPNCPNNAATIILASHVFNEDGDIVRFCAVNNALDWTTESNAGFLPSGMQGQNANDARVLADYRKNLGVLNASSFQLWQADPDPEVMDLLDMKNGFGSIYPRAATSVGDDLFVLCAEGVRNITQAAGNNSNTAGAVGAPIDDLVLAKMAELANNSDVVSAYYPGLGQYLLAFPTEEDPGEIPLDESGYAFTFNSSNATISGSTVSYTGASFGDFSIAFPTIPQDTVLSLRIVCTAWSQATGGTPAVGEFVWTTPTVPGSQSNTGNPLTEFLPNPLDITVQYDPSEEDFRVSFNYFSESDTTFEFQFFVIGVAPVPAETECFVATKMSGGGWSWSRYVFPFAITDFALFENDLYFRHGDHISYFDKSLTHDELDATGAQTPVPFAGRIQWNWLDMGAPGNTKHMQAFDLIATGAPSVSFGYNERQKDTAFTDAYSIDADTLPDGPIQYEVTAPSISVRIDFAAGTAWSMSSFIAYVDDLGPNV